jgi:putative membrane protein
MRGSIATDLSYLFPWEFSPTVLLCCVLALLLYLRGLRARLQRGAAVGFWGPFSFLLGLALTYGVLQTWFDYLSQHMFWVHRLQHLVLHHVGPFLMVIAAPGPVMREGLPARWREPVAQWGRYGPWRWGVAIIQNPFVAGFLFVGLVYFWLTPSIHFTAMLDVNRYRLMNWGMAVDGLLFWWLMLTPRAAQGNAAVSYGQRIVILVVAGFLQLFLGAFIVMHKGVLFDVYGICGRAWAISPITDQQIGGLLTWIPPAMMSVIGVLIVIHHMLRDAEPNRGLVRSAQARRRAVRVAAAGPSP